MSRAVFNPVNKVYRLLVEGIGTQTVYRIRGVGHNPPVNEN